MTLAPLATETDYNKYVGPSPAVVNVNDLLTAASDMVRRYCGWAIGPETSETFTLDGSGSSTLLLPTLRLVAVTAVSNGGVTVDPTTVEWSADGYLRTSGCWTCKLRGVTVTVDHGFDLEDITDVVAAVCQIAARSASVPSGVASESALSQSISYLSGGVSMLQQEISTLAAYRLPRRA